MKYLQFTHVDSETGINVAAEPAQNGPVFPAVVGLQFEWARESQYPTNAPALFGTCPDESGINIDGVIAEFNQGDYEQMRADEMNARPNPEATRIAALWQAAHDYEYAQVSGSAIGLLAMGAMQQKPHCIAVMGWIQSIWTEYYTRKAAASTDCDYGNCGVCPFTVPELMVELGL